MIITPLELLGAVVWPRPPAAAAGVVARICYSLLYGIEVLKAVCTAQPAPRALSVAMDGPSAPAISCVPLTSRDDLSALHRFGNRPKDSGARVVIGRSIEPKPGTTASSGYPLSNNRPPTLVGFLGECGCVRSV